MAKKTNIKKILYNLKINVDIATHIGIIIPELNNR